MKNQPLHDELRSELRRRGLPSAYIERLVAELNDHYSDILEERNTSMGAARKLDLDQDDFQQRLGEPAQLALFAAEQYHARSFWGRHPLLTFAVVPLPLFAVCVFCFSVVLVTAGYCLAFVLENVLGLAAGEPQDYVLLQGIVLGLTSWYIAVLPPLAAAVLLCRVYRRNSLDWRWPALGCLLLATISGIFTVSYRIATEPNNGLLMFGFKLDASIHWLLLSFLPKFAVALGIGLLLVKRAGQKLELEASRRTAS